MLTTVLLGGGSQGRGVSTLQESAFPLIFTLLIKMETEKGNGLMSQNQLAAAHVGEFVTKLVDFRDLPNRGD